MPQILVFATNNAHKAQPDPYSGMAKLMDAMRPLFLTNNPYNTDYDNGGPSIEDYVSQTNNEDILLQEEAIREAEKEMIDETVNEEEDETLTEEEVDTLIDSWK